jgi:hypothetical protein
MKKIMSLEKEIAKGERQNALLNPQKSRFLESCGVSQLILEWG